MERSEEYFIDKGDGYSQCDRDILAGKLRIHEVPFFYRTKSLYIKAYDAVQAIYPDFDQENKRELERKLIKTQLLNDIIKSEKNKLYPNAQSLRKCYLIFEDLDEIRDPKK